MMMFEYPADRVVATPLQYGIDLVSIPESPNHRASHLTVSEMPSPSPPSKADTHPQPHPHRRKSTIPDPAFDAPAAGLGELQFYFDDVVVERSSTGGFAEACYRGDRGLRHTDAHDFDDDADGYTDCSSGYSSAGEVPTTPPTSSGIKREDEGHLWFEMPSPGGDHTAGLVPEMEVPLLDVSDPETTTELFAAYVEKAQHPTFQSVYHQSPAPPSKRKRLSLTIDIAALSNENIDHIIKKSPTSTAHGAGGDSPPAAPVMMHLPKTTVPAKKRKSPSPPSSHHRRRATPEPPQHRHTAAKSHKSKSHKAKSHKAHKKAAASAKAIKAVKVKIEIKTEDDAAPTDRFETPAQEKKRKMEGNRRAAKKFRLKQKAKEGVMMIKVRELEAINSRLVAELALIRQLR